MSAIRRLLLIVVLVATLFASQPAWNGPSALPAQAAQDHPVVSPQALTPDRPAPTAPRPGQGLLDAVRTGKWPSQIAASTGAIRPDLHGPQRTDPAEGIPTHAYSPFDERTNREYPCPPGGCEFMQGQLLVKLAPQTQPLPRKEQTADRLTADRELDSALAVQGVLSLEPIFPNARPPAADAMAMTPDGGTIPLPDLTRWQRAALADATTDVYAVAESLAKLPGIAWAEPDYLRKPVGDNGRRTTDDGRPAGAVASSVVGGRSSFSDPLYAQQWHLAATNVPQAWDWLASQGLPPGGSRDIVVAVIDTGVDYNHPDLAANIWVNAAEFNGLPGVDDDGNGYVDDIHGADMITNSGNPLDDHGHGTHVAGIIAAQAGNGIGGVGVAYNVQVMAIKAAQYSGVLASSDIAEGIYYAKANGADVINMSFGGYSRSQLEEDALAVAFGQAVLVAAAGNDSKVNLPCLGGRDMYPAAYNWVLGVMASQQIQNSVTGWRAGFSNYDCIARDSHEYELMAPGVDVWSTLPNEQYAAWDGTSMATPVISGIAALARTKWADKDVYSSRFIMGQIAANAQGGVGGVANAYAALTVPPQPELSYLEHWTFDTATQAAGNDDDGIVDAGETIDLAIVIRNHWGKADPVTVTLEAWAAGAFQPDPYVTMITGTVDYGAVGSFNIDDNGLIYDAQGVITGVRYPFRFSVSPNTPNDHVIPFRLTMVAGNGYDPAAAPLTFVSRFNLIVQRGRELPRIINQDMTLTKDYYWLIPDATLIEAGVHVTVTEGTQVQFWSGDPNDPYHGNPNTYLQVEGSFVTQGTVTEPVELFQWSLFPSYEVRLTGTGARLSYARVRNFNGGASAIDHCYFDQDAIDLAPQMVARSITRSIFHKVGGSNGTHNVQPNDRWEENLYDSSNVALHLSAGHRNVFLKNYKLYETQWGNRTYYTSWANNAGYAMYKLTFLRTAFPAQYNGKTYVALQRPYNSDASNASNYLELAELFANHLGGHVVTINDAAENQFLFNYWNNNFGPTVFQQTYPSMNCCSSSSPCSCWVVFEGGLIIGLTDRDTEGQFRWISGESISYTNWGSSQPDNGNCPTCNQDFVRMWSGGQWDDYDGPAGPVILELPGTAIDDTTLEAARQYFIADGAFNGFRENAILNVWWDPNTSHWMRFYMDNDRDWVRYLTNNFWGTTATTLIDAAIQDYNDDFNKGLYDYLPMLTTAPTTTYPFVVNVTLSTSSQAGMNALNGPTPLVGAEPVTFTVTFNRDMDTAIQPAVSFGPDVPETDYTVHGIGGGWTSPRTWQGTFNITPVTGDGYQFMRIAGAVAADDPWLVTGDDSERFRFEVITRGAESMNLQATGGEGRVSLMWTQTDFELLSGFNLYRATTQDGAYSRINTSIIPPQTRAYTDTAVTPGQPYYYKFTVVKSDMSESDFSNVATATPLDTIPPTVVHTPVTSAAPGLALTLYADVTDNVAVQAVSLYYRAIGATSYLSRTMTLTTGVRYSATVEGSRVASPGLEYYIEATDGISRARAGRADFPYPVAVVDRPVVTAVSPNRGPAPGGTPVTIAGSNFKAGATVTFGGAACGGVTVVSSSQISCTTPPHYPEAADVTVTNPDLQSGTLLRGFTFESDTATLGLPDTAAEQHAVVEVPVNLANVGGLLAADLTITFDGGVLQAQGARAGALISGWSLTTNTNTPGQVRLAMASPGGSVTGAGVLVYLQFEVIGAAGVTSTLHVASASLNDGAIPVQLADGAFTVNLAYSVAGAVRYWYGSAGVPGVTLSLAGDTVYTGVSDPTGAYTVTGARRDAYVLTPGKTDAAHGISAYDASLVLQHAVGLITLTGDAATAADVNRSGAIAAMDASYILQAAVGLITPPFPGAGAVWRFSPATLSYGDLSTDRTGQDFTAVLLGDVSGNWSAGGAYARSNDFSRSSATVRVQNAGATATVWLDPATPVYSLELLLTYPAAQADVLAVEPGPAARGMALTTNLAEPSRIRIALAGARPITQAGALLTIRLRPTTDDRPALTPAWGEVNEGATPVRLVEGWRYHLPVIGGGAR